MKKKKHSTAPPGIELRVLRILVARFNHQLRSRDRNCGLWIFSSDPAVSSSIIVGAEREENLIRNDPDKSEFTKVETSSERRLRVRSLSAVMMQSFSA